MTKFHINKKGVPAICRAEKGKCPFGGASGSENHFDSKMEAQEHANKVNLVKFSLLPGEGSNEFYKEVTELDQNGITKIRKRLESMMKDDIRIRKETKNVKSNYISRCRTSEFIPDYVPKEEDTIHYRFDRKDKRSRLIKDYGKGELVGHYRVNHEVKDETGKGEYDDQIVEIRDNGMIIIYDNDTGRTVTSFMANKERIEVMMLKTNQIPDSKMLRAARANHYSETLRWKDKRKNAEPVLST